MYIYESVVVPIKDNAYFWKFSLLLARSARISNICIYLHSGDPHKGYSLNNGGHNISFGKCTGGLTILDPPGPIELCHVALWKFRLRFEASGLPPLKIMYKLNMFLLYPITILACKFTIITKMIVRDGWVLLAFHKNMLPCDFEYLLYMFPGN
jgi:hypothetical protein